MQLYARSASGLPMVDSSQSSTASTWSVSASNMRLSRRKSPCTSAAPPSRGIEARSHAISCCMAGDAGSPSTSDVLYCRLQRDSCRS